MGLQHAPGRCVVLKAHICVCIELTRIFQLVLPVLFVFGFVVFFFFSKCYYILIIILSAVIKIL